MADRATNTSDAVRRELYEARCPGCGRPVMKDGRRGLRNQATACSPVCRSKARQAQVAEGMLSTGGVFNVYSAAESDFPLPI